MTTHDARNTDSSRCLSDRRSQSEVIGVVIVLGMVLLGSMAVVVFGADAFSSAEDQLSDERAEKALTQLDSKAGLVALGQSDSQRVTFPSNADEHYYVDEDAGWLRATVVNMSGASFEALNVTMGALVYENGQTKLAYQGGGVWRTNRDNNSMISPPEFHYRNGTLTLPAVTIANDSQFGSTATVSQAGEETIFPLPSNVNKTNPLDNHRVELTVSSEYYIGWGHYFEERTDGDVAYDHEDETVTITLVTPVTVNEITAASASLSAGGQFNVSGNSASTCGDAGDVFTDSYNSGNGSYCSQWGSEPPGKEGDVVYGEDIDITDGTGGSNFYGDISSGETVTVDDSSGKGQPSVYGNISYVDTCLPAGECSDRIASGSGGQVKEIDGIQQTESIDWYVNNSVYRLKSEADQHNPAIEGETLDAGQYYFDTFHLDTDLELDTSDGTVAIAVREDVSLGNDAEISVTGDGHVELYIGGESGVDELVMADDSAISVTNDNATRFRLYGKSDFDATIGGGGTGNIAVFTGVIYAPPGSTGNGTVILDGGEIFGGILTGRTQIDGGSIHYDEALEGRRVVPDDARIIRVTFLHVTRNEIEISG
jgi:flagellin-like protein